MTVAMFGFKTKREKELEQENASLMAKLGATEAAFSLQKNSLDQAHAELRVLRVIGPKMLDVDIGDPEPTDEKLRNTYAASVALFFEEYLGKKLMWLIGQVREDLDSPFGVDPSRVRELPPGTTRAEYDWFLRGTTNGLKLLLDWGDRMKNERAAFIQKQKETDAESNS